MKTRNALVLIVVGLSSVAAYAWQRESRVPARGGRDSPTASSSSPQVVIHEHRYVAVDGKPTAAGRAVDEKTAVDGRRAAEEKPSFDAEEHNFQLESAFDDDAAPTGKSRVRESTIRTAFASPLGTGSTVKSLECRASRCRMEVEFDDTEADRRVIREVLMRSDLDMAGAVPERKVGKDGKVSAVIHLFPPASTPPER